MQRNVETMQRREGAICELFKRIISLTFYTMLIAAFALLIVKLIA